MEFGAHVSKANRKSLLDAIHVQVHKFGFNCVQIFTHGPQNSKQNNIDIPSIKSYCKKNMIGIIIHSAYVANGMWDISKLDAYKNIIGSQAKACRELDAYGFVVHLPNRPMKDITNVLHALRRELKDTLILLETNANGTYSDPKKLAELCEELRKVNIDWKICIDTAHLWCSGFNLTTKDAANDWLKAFGKPDDIGLIHFNGSYVPFGMKRDKHAIAWSKDDYMWGGHNAGTFPPDHNDGGHAFLDYAKKYDIPVICEINVGNVEDAEKLFEHLFTYGGKSSS